MSLTGQIELNHLSNLVAGFAILNSHKGGKFESDGRRHRSRRSTILGIANTFIWYLFLRSRTEAKLKELPVPGEFQYYTSVLVRQETLKFVLAHKLAHWMLGHVDDVAADHTHELEADRDAVSIL